MKTQDEEQLDSFVLKNKEQPVIPDNQVPSVEDTVSKKAREGKPLPTTVLQNKSTLSDIALEKRIADSLRKNVGTLDEQLLRGDIAAHLQSNGGDITEAQYQGIVNAQLKASEEAQEEAKPSLPSGALLSPPPLVSSAVGALQGHVAGASDWASGLATPGGIGVLVAILLFFVWAIVPVSGGKTRLQLLWGIITGQVELQKEYTDAEKTATSVVGAGADLPNTGVTTPSIPIKGTYGAVTGAGANFGGGFISFEDM